MKEVINNYNKYKLKYWFAMLYIHGRKFMIGSVFTYQRLSEDYLLLMYQNLGVDFCVPKSSYRSQKRPVLPTGVVTDSTGMNISSFQRKN